MSQIMTELAGKWKGFTDEQKAGIAEGIAGRQQAAVFQSLMQNFDVFKKAQKELNAGDAFDSMKKENDQFVKSIAGQLNKLKEIWIGVFQDLFNPKLFGGLLKGAILVSQAIATIVNALDDVGALTPVLALLGASFGAKMIPGVVGLVTVLGGATRSMGLFGRAASRTSSFMGPPTRSAFLFGEALTGISLLTSPLLGVAAALAVVGLGVAAYNHLTVSTAEESKAIDKSIQSRKSEIKTINDKVSSLKSIQKEYDKLNQITDKNNEQNARFAELSNQIAQIRPDLVIGKDEKGNAILSMSGDVEDLIKKMEKAKKLKEELLADDTKRKGENSRKKLSGDTGNAITNLTSESENDKLEKITGDHISKMMSLEKKRTDTVNKLYSSTGEKRKELVSELAEIDGKIGDEQSKFISDYTNKINTIKKLSSENGKGIFAGIEKEGAFKGAKNGVKERFDSLRSSLDFSDIQTDVQVKSAEDALNKIIISADKGNLHIGNLKKSLDGANREFEKTGNIDKYNKTIKDLVNEVSSKTGADKNVLTDLFAGIDTSAGKSKSSLDKFLNAYNKSAADINNGDSFAKALATQKASIDSGIASINDALSSEDINVHKKVAVDLENDESLPEQLRTMIKTLIDKGGNETDVLKFSQKLMMDISEGDLNIDEANKEIEAKFGKNKFKITSDILIGNDAKIAGIETVVNQITEKFGEIPPVVKTIIETDGITSYNEANKVYELYKSFPENVQTSIETNGLDKLKDLKLVEELYKHLPPEIATEIVNNAPEAIKGSNSYNEVLEKLPKEITTKVNADTGLSRSEIEGVSEQLSGLPIETEVKVNVIKALATGNIDSIKKALDAVPKEKRTEVIAAIQKALAGIGTVESKKLSKKVAQLDANNKPAKDKINAVNNTKMKDKKTNVSAPGATNAKSKLDSINNTKLKDKSFKITTIFQTIGKALANAAGGKLTGSGNISKPNSVSPVSTPIAPMSPSPSVAPMSTGSTVAPTSSPAPMSTGTTSSTPISVTNSNVNSSMKYDVNLLKELENRIQMVGNQLSILDKKMENAIGEKKIAYIQQQNKLYNEQITLQQDLAKKLEKEKSYYQYFLKNKGFNFTKDGNFKNYEEKLLAMEKEAARLVNDAENKSNTASSYNGKNEKTKNNLESVANGAKKKSDEYNESLANTKKYLEEYTQVALTDLPKVKEDYEDLTNALLENKKEMREISRQQRLFLDTNKIKSLSNEYDKIADRLGIIDIKMDNVYGKDRLNLINEQIGLMEKQKKTQLGMIESLKHEMVVYQHDLDDFGFKFDANGGITNYEAVMKKFKDSGSLEEITSLTEAYFNLYRNELPDAKKNMVELDNAIKNSYKSQLQTTKDMQDKVTSVYKKQVEERKKLLDDELKSKTDALDKEKEAYNKLRDELDYKDDYNEQKDVIDKLQKKIDIANQDSSLGNQKKLQDLTNQMKEEQKKLQDLVQSNVDEQVNNMYDKESERLTDNAEKKKEDLDKIYSDANIQKLVDSAISSGKFVDLDGNIRSLKDTMLEFENEFGDGMTAIGGLVKSELVSNLELARETLKDMGDISTALGLSKVSSYNNIAVPSTMSSVSPVTNQSVTVQFNQPLISVQGNVTQDVMPQLEMMIKEAQKQITENIVKKIK